MLNIEKYKDELEKIANNQEGGRFAKVNDKLCECIKTSCIDCDFKKYGNHKCSLNKLNWLSADSEEPTDFQKDIKENIVDKVNLKTYAQDLANQLAAELSRFLQEDYYDRSKK